MSFATARFVLGRYQRIGVVSRKTYTFSPRRFSSTEAAKNTKAAVEVEAEKATEIDSGSASGLLEGSTTRDLGQLIRHGKGDATIALNVGGKEFLTLRSTVNSNPVLANHVARAEANNEFRSGAVFIDREPTHFGFILQYLRNRVELLSYSYTSTSSKSSYMTNKVKTITPAALKKFTEQYVRLPKDKETLRDLYIEATYYRCEELQDAISGTGWIYKFFDALSDGNPFDVATKWLARIRNFAIAFTTLGGLGGTLALAVQHDFDLLLKSLGIRDKEPDEESVSVWEALGFSKSKKIKKEEKSSVVEVISNMGK